MSKATALTHSRQTVLTGEYSFTEKKRIRKSFAKRSVVLDVPFMLIGGSDRLAQAAPPGTERRSLAPGPAIFTESGPRIADFVDEFIADVEG